MKHTLYIGFIMAFSIIVFAGCAKQNIKLLNADIAYDEGRTDDALALYLKILDKMPDGEHTDYAHFYAAELYKSQGKWDDAIQHYQAIVTRDKNRYYTERAGNRITDVREQRQVIEQESAVYQNHLDSEQRKAAAALIAIGDAYYTIGDYADAIRYYKKFVAEFPDHERAAQIQFKVGDIYFYKLYNYEMGWPEFAMLIESGGYKDTQEAREAEELLTQVEVVLESIKQDIDFVTKSLREVPLQTGQLAQSYIIIARTWENEPLRNYSNAIKAYQELADKLPMEKFVAAEAMFKVGELYQQLERYERALHAYDTLCERYAESLWCAPAIYNQARCYEILKEFTKAYEHYKIYMALGESMDFYRAAEQKVRQFEQDQDGDGYPFYKEEEAGTSDQDSNAYPSSQAVRASNAEEGL